MSSNDGDILLPRAAWSAQNGRARIAAFVPITLALAGVAAILLGGLSVRGPETAVASVTGVDPIVTGSIVSDEQRRHALEMLDR
jgi:heptaprenylglyceryl phosphate synthase